MSFEMSFPLFGKNIIIVFTGINEFMVEEHKEDIVKEALRLQKIFNFYDDKSELSALNNKRTMIVSKELLFVVQQALQYSKMSQGLYDISMGAIFRAKKNGEPYSAPNYSYKDILLTGNTVSLLHKDILVDLGSIAKGYIVDALGEFMSDIGFEHYFIDARGDILCKNHVTNIDIQNPRSTGLIGTFTLKSAGVATSGDYMQHSGNYENNHLLNNTDFSSVTVIHPSLMIADALATIISVSGQDILKSDVLHDAKVCVVDKKGNIVLNTMLCDEVTL